MVEWRAVARLKEERAGARAMSQSVPNPDQYMSSLGTIIAQGRKRIGLLIGAGAPASMAPFVRRQVARRASGPPTTLQSSEIHLRTGSSIELSLRPAVQNVVR
jgi:hypothetical protein